MLSRGKFTYKIKSKKDLSLWLWHIFREPLGQLLQSQYFNFWHALLSASLDLLYEGAKHKKNASQHPGLQGHQPFSLWCVDGDAIEDVDQHQEDCHKQRHAAGDHLWRDHKGDPWGHHKQSWIKEDLGPLSQIGQQCSSNVTEGISFKDVFSFVLFYLTPLTRNYNSVHRSVRSCDGLVIHLWTTNHNKLIRKQILVNRTGTQKLGLTRTNLYNQTFRLPVNNFTIDRSKTSTINIFSLIC